MTKAKIDGGISAPSWVLNNNALIHVALIIVFFIMSCRGYLNGRAILILAHREVKVIVVHLAYR